MFDSEAHETEQSLSDKKLRELHFASCHEIAHAAAAIEAGRPAAFVTVFFDEQGTVRGLFHHAPSCSPVDEHRLPDVEGHKDYCRTVKAILNHTEPPDWLYADLVTLLAGIAFHLPHDPVAAFGCSADDYQEAFALAQAMSTPTRSVRQLLDTAINGAAEICDRNRGPILRLADDLVIRRRMDAAEIRAAVEASFPKSVSDAPDPDDPSLWPSLHAVKRLRIWWADPQPEC
jgi:hypothetical protein